MISAGLAPWTLKDLIITSLVAIYHQASTTNLPVSVHDECLPRLTPARSIIQIIRKRSESISHNYDPYRQINTEDFDALPL